MSKDGWIGVDLDGTLAQYPATEHGKWAYAWNHIGDPVPAMLARVKAWIAEGKEVRIVTARVFPYIHGNPAFTHAYSYEQTCLVSGEKFQIRDMLDVVYAYCGKHVGEYLPVTCAKDWKMVELWDDRAVQVIPNTGKTLAEERTSHLVAMTGKAWGSA
jgi:hypothetical protein